jgi:carbamoyltransferase
MLILAYNGYVFDSAACLVRDGELLSAVQEERFVRRKFTGEFPEQSIRYCLEQAGATLADVDHVAFYWEPFHQLHRRLGQIASTLPASLRYWSSHSGKWWSMLRTESELVRRIAPPGARLRHRFHFVRHHLAHAASAFFVSPWERAAILTLDGAGEMSSGVLASGEDRRIEILREVRYPHSMGYVYVSLTHYLGFTPDSDEYKVMALASYGGPSRYYDLFREIITLRPDGGFSVDSRYFAYQTGRRDPWVSDRFVEEFGPLRKRGEPVAERHQAIAWALQRRLEDVALHAARTLHATTKARHLCLAGGVALNSVMNQRLRAEGPFEDVFVPPAPNDAGTPIGAAYYVRHQVLGEPRSYVFRSPYLGPEHSDEACAAALREAGLESELLDEESLAARVAALLAEGRIVGWYQGRMEIGPRALGNRSILADPRRADMQDIVNERIKHREPFRPFAPAVLEEAAGEFFLDARPLPYMIFVLPVRAEKRDVIPAVVHVDGTARVQTVSRELNPRFHRLIAAFGARTGVPVLLNTSFNDNGEPIVESPAAAVRSFRSTNLDHLVLGRRLVTRAGVSALPATPPSPAE